MSSAASATALRPAPGAAPREARPAPPADQPTLRSGTLLAVTGSALLAAGLAGTLLSHGGRRPPTAARLAACGSALLAASVLADSAMEHYRGNFRRRAMFAAPTAAAVTLAAGLATALTSGARMMKSALFGGSIVTGLFGLGFHARNILSRPGGLSFNNLFYRAPFGAPGALVLAGAAGLGAIAADRAAASPTLLDGRRRHRRAGQGLGLATAAGLFGLTTEIGLLHFRGAFHNKLMYAPVVTVPLTGLAMLGAAVDPEPARTMIARRALGATAALGILGTGLHSYGVSRNMGGFYNWTQNLFQGPPIAAPPSLAGIALMGFAALRLLERRTGARAG
ncbi:hypothetical protein NPA31_010345 [Aurantimonas sp. MSK8Z-1]|uniref:hypothetical protein n=1 Tax=Mangrovibrevibacter kandeliae TaxID=2968473 RepID=UPI0021193EA3|nr:hypothetical protein [Aurantimonas sp. MSK8Z-1]MCW4115359.1 hypothetical protein [Aurantimonas sp. MSK8Z-1]